MRRLLRSRPVLRGQGCGRTLWLLAGLVLAGAACSSGGGEASTTTTTVRVASTAPPTTAAVTTTTSRWTPEQQAVVDTYLAWDRAFNEASTMEKPDFTDMAKYAYGDLLVKNKLLLTSRSSDGRQARPGVNGLTRTEVYRYGERNGKSYIDFCSVDDYVVFRRADGHVIDDEVQTRRGGAQVEQVSGQWKVTGTEIVQRWPGDQLPLCLND
jgi:hypothetical protein